MFLIVSTQNLIIYKFTSLYHILEELDLDLKIIYFNDENTLNDKIKKLDNYLIVSDKKYLNIANQFILEIVPINILKLLEKIANSLSLSKPDPDFITSIAISNAFSKLVTKSET